MSSWQWDIWAWGSGKRSDTWDVTCTYTHIVKKWLFGNLATTCQSRNIAFFQLSPAQSQASLPDRTRTTCPVASQKPNADWVVGVDSMSVSGIWEWGEGPTTVRAFTLLTVVFTGPEYKDLEGRSHNYSQLFKSHSLSRALLPMYFQCELPENRDGAIFIFLPRESSIVPGT